MKKIASSKELLKIVGKNIEHTRVLKDKSVKEIAGSLGLTDSAYRNIERGKSGISIVKLFQISKALDVHFFQLLGSSSVSTTKETLTPIIGSDNPIAEGFKLCINQCNDEIIFLKQEIAFLRAQLEEKNTGKKRTAASQ